MKKYEFTEETMEFEGYVLHRIKALIDFGDVKAGDLGGWIEKEENLSQENNCWVFGNARVYENAQIFGNVWVYENTQIFGDTLVFGNARVYKNAQIFGDALVFGNARVYDNAKVFGDASIYGNSQVCGNAWVYGDAQVFKNVKVFGSAKINKTIYSTNSYMLIGPIGSRDDFTTFIKTEEDIWVNCGCFSGIIEDFAIKVKETHRGTIHEKKYLNAIRFAKNNFEEE